MKTTPTLVETARGVWEIRWSEKINGVWRSSRKSTRTTDRESAEMALAKFLLERGAPIAASASVNRVLDEYLRKWSLPRGNERTDRIVLRAPREAFGTRDPRSICQDDIDRYAVERARGKHGKVPVGQSTIAREVTALQAALNWGAKHLLVPGRPVFRFTKPSNRGGRRLLWLTEAQEREVLSKVHLTTRSVEAFLRMGLTYGARAGAMMDLRFTPEQVSWDGPGVIDFRVPGRRLTRKRRATVPMTPEVRSVLEILRQQRAEGQHVLDTTTQADFRSYMAAIGYGWVTAHVMKHTAITLLLRAGRRPEDVAEATQTDVRTILDVYRHYAQDEKLAVFRRA